MKNKYWYIPLVIGLMISATGVALIIIGSTIYVPSMDSGDWFEASSMESFCIVLGAFLTFAGLITGVSISFSLKNRSVFGEDQNKVGNPQNIALTEQMKRLFGIKDNKEEEIYCEYCDSRLQKGETKCPNCGAKVKKSK